MNSILDVMEQLLVSGTKNTQYSHILFEETDPLAELNNLTVTVRGHEGNWFEFKPDKLSCGTMSPLLKCSDTAHHRACDGVIVLERGGKVLVVYVELKSSLKPHGYTDQFRSTRCFMKYLFALAHEFHDVPDATYEERFVLVHRGTLNKQTTIPKNPPISHDPMNPKKITVANRASRFLAEIVD